MLGCVFVTDSLSGIEIVPAEVDDDVAGREDCEAMVADDAGNDTEFLLPSAMSGESVHVGVV